MNRKGRSPKNNSESRNSKRKSNKSRGLSHPEQSKEDPATDPRPEYSSQRKKQKVTDSIHGTDSQTSGQDHSRSQDQGQGHSHSFYHHPGQSSVKASSALTKPSNVNYGVVSFSSHFLPDRKHTSDPSNRRHSDMPFKGTQDDQGRRILNPLLQGKSQMDNKNPPLNSNQIQKQQSDLEAFDSNSHNHRKRSSVTKPATYLASYQGQGHGQGQDQGQGQGHTPDSESNGSIRTDLSGLRDDALQQLINLHDARLGMLQDLQLCQSQLNKENLTKFRELSDEIAQERKERKKDIMDLKKQMDRCEKNLTKNVIFLKMFINSTQSRGRGQGQGQGQDGEEGKSSKNQNNEALPDESSTDRSGSCENSDDDGDEENEKESLEETTDDEEDQQNLSGDNNDSDSMTKLQNQIDYFNQTLTGQLKVTSSTSSLAGSTGSGTSNSISKIIPTVTDITAKAAQITEALKTDKALLGPVMPPKKAVPATRNCPYCNKSLSKTYINRHIKNVCLKKAAVETTTETAPTTSIDSRVKVDGTSKNSTEQKPKEKTARTLRAERRGI